MRLTLQALENVRQLEVDDRAAALVHLLSDLEAAPAAAAGGRWTLHEDDHGWALHEDLALLGRADHWMPLAVRVLRRVDDVALDRRTAFVAHGAAVRLDGRVAIMPAESGAGKTTLAAACLAAGMGYLSDEALPFSAAGELLPYPRPLALDRAGQQLLDLPPPVVHDAAEGWYRASDLGPVAGSTPTCRVTDVVLPRRRSAERERPDVELRPLDPAVGAQALLRNGLNHFHDATAAFLTATAVATASRVWCLEYDDAPTAARWLSARWAAEART
jgi:hypothetical protein